jgi:hypothetical protein
MAAIQDTGSDKHAHLPRQPHDTTLQTTKNQPQDLQSLDVPASYECATYAGLRGRGLM